MDMEGSGVAEKSIGSDKLFQDVDREELLRVVGG